MKQISLLKSGLWITFSNFAKRFFALLSNLILARLLLPSEFGVIGIAYVFWSFFTLFTQNSTGLFILYKGTDDKDYLNTSYTISLIVGVVLALTLVALAPLIANFFHEPDLAKLLIFYAFNLVLSSNYYIYFAIMTRNMQYQELATDTMIASTTRLVFTTGAALIGMSYWSFAIGDMAFWIVGSTLARYQSGYKLRLQIVPKVRAEVISYCIGAVGSSFGFYANSNLDNFTVGKLLGKTSLGYYNLAYQLSMALSTILNPVISMLGTPIFAQLPDEQQQQEALFKVTEQIAFLATPLYALIFLIIDEHVITIVFGQNWIPVTPVLPWLLVSAYFRTINNPLKSMLSAKGLPGINARVNLVIAPIAVLGFVVGAQQGGILGVAIAAAVILGFVWTTYWWWVGCRALGWSIKQFLVPCLQPVMLALPAFAISFSLPAILRAFVFILFYFVCVRLVAPSQFGKYHQLVIKMTKHLTKISIIR
ncbi:MAG TPA: polysaccharide biosynthesis protein [Cyanobacteria bacterium UBA8803]|nr:polysaccharide biosynthesis protein [Cyanobacteria bacterium UBA9273]HBL59480.1 polysaccharide biosynthesis protein [Cyanobacteria bacterium UBA8803]